MLAMLADRTRTFLLATSKRQPSTGNGLRARRMTIASATILVLLAAQAWAQKPVTASEGWVKLPGAGETATTAFAVVENPTMYDIYVVSVSAEVAAEVRLRQRSASGAMEPVKEVPAPAYGSLTMAADGVHMVLSGLKRPLKAGDTVVLTLATDSGQTLQVSAVVR